MVYNNLEMQERRVLDFVMQIGLDDRKSVSGYLFQLNGCSVSWRSKINHVALSTAEAEYLALSSAVQEALWIKQLLIDLNVNIETPMTIYEDNKAAVSMSKNPQFNGRAKHVEIKVARLDFFGK